MQNFKLINKDLEVKKRVFLSKTSLKMNFFQNDKMVQFYFMRLEMF